MNLRIEAAQVVLMVELLDTPTAKALVAALPFEARADLDRRAPKAREPL